MSNALIIAMRSRIKPYERSIDLGISLAQTIGDLSLHYMPFPTRYPTVVEVDRLMTPMLIRRLGTPRTTQRRMPAESPTKTTQTMPRQMMASSPIQAGPSRPTVKPRRRVVDAERESDLDNPAHRNAQRVVDTRAESPRQSVTAVPHLESRPKTPPRAPTKAGPSRAAARPLAKGVGTGRREGGSSKETGRGPVEKDEVQASASGSGSSRSSGQGVTHDRGGVQKRHASNLVRPAAPAPPRRPVAPRSAAVEGASGPESREPKTVVTKALRARSGHVDTVERSIPGLPTAASNRSTRQAAAQAPAKSTMPKRKRPSDEAESSVEKRKKRA